MELEVSLMCFTQVAGRCNSRSHKGIGDYNSSRLKRSISKPRFVV